MIDREVELIVKYSYPKLVMEEYFDARSLIFNNLAEDDIKTLKEEKKNALNKVINKISKRIIGNRQVIDGSLKEDRIMPIKVYYEDISSHIDVVNMKFNHRIGSSGLGMSKTFRQSRRRKGRHLQNG